MCVCFLFFLGSVSFLFRFVSFRFCFVSFRSVSVPFRSVPFRVFSVSVSVSVAFRCFSLLRFVLFFVFLCLPFSLFLRLCLFFFFFFFSSFPPAGCGTCAEVELICPHVSCFTSAALGHTGFCLGRNNEVVSQRSAGVNLRRKFAGGCCHVDGR